MQNNSKINMLRGPDRVRKRPAVIFGSSDVDGAIVAVKSVLGIFITEAAMGCSRRLSVTLHQDGSIEVRSFDRGFYIDETIEDGFPRWHQFFLALYPAPKDTTGEYVLSKGKQHHELYGDPCALDSPYIAKSDITFSIYAAHCACEFMNIEATRDGFMKRLSFRKGVCVGDVQTKPSDEPTGSRVHFLLDNEVFDSTDIPISWFTSVLQDAALTIPGLQCELVDEKGNQRKIYQYEMGVQTLAAQLCSIPPYFAETEVRGKDKPNWPEYDAKIRIACGFTSEGGFVRCLHDCRHLQYGGRHLNEAKKQIVSAIQTVFGSKARGLRDFNSIAEHIILLVDTQCSEHGSYWENGTRMSITNQLVADITSDLICDGFVSYLRKHYDKMLEILKGI